MTKSRRVRDHVYDLRCWWSTAYRDTSCAMKLSCDAILPSFTSVILTSFRGRLPNGILIRELCRSRYFWKYLSCNLVSFVHKSLSASMSSMTRSNYRQTSTKSDPWTSFIVCQAPKALIRVSRPCPPKHQMRLYVCHQMRLYVCHQMRWNVCHQIRLMSPTELASLAFTFARFARTFFNKLN